MTLDPVRNFVKVTLNSGYNSSATSVSLTTGDGAKLPDPSVEGAFNLVWWDETAYLNPVKDPNVEVVRVTARTGDVLTISRAQEDTTATNKNTTDHTYVMLLGLTRKMIEDIKKFALPVLNAGSVLFSDGTTIAQDNAKLYWDNTNKRLGLGTSNPNAGFHMSDGSTLHPAFVTVDKFIGTYNNTAPGMSFVVAGASSAYRGVFKATRARGTLSAPTAAQNGDLACSLLGNLFDGTAGRPTAAVDMTVDGTVYAGVILNAAGTGYSVNDTLTIAGGTAGTVRVLAVGAGGEVTQISLLAGGTGYSTGTGVATSYGGAGSGCTVDITYVVGGVITYNAPLRLSFLSGGLNGVTRTERMQINAAGNVGIGLSPTAYFHIKAGTASASTAPIKLTAGTLNTTPEAGAIEFDGTDFYFTI